MAVKVSWAVVVPTMMAARAARRFIVSVCVSLVDWISLLHPTAIGRLGIWII